MATEPDRLLHDPTRLTAARARQHRVEPAEILSIFNRPGERMTHRTSVVGG